MSYDGSTLTPLDMPPGTSSSLAFAINDSNQIGGHRATPDGYRSFIINGKEFINIDPLPGHNWVEFGDLNSNGIVVGAMGHNGTGPFPLAYRWENGILQDISVDLPLKGGSFALGVSDSGLITGYMGYTASPQNTHAFIWNDGIVTDLGLPFPECFATEGRDITKSGHVCGLWWKPVDQNPGFARRGFFYDGETFTDLGEVPRGGLDVYATSLNESDQVVGFSGNIGFLWQEGSLYALYDLTIQDGPIVFVTAAHRITDDGRIYGDGWVEGYGSPVAVRLTPLPKRPGDVTCDLAVNVDDLLAVINGWGPCDETYTCSETSMPLSVSDCMNEADQRFTAFSPEWEEYLNGCIDALCKAEIIDCD